MRVYLGNFDEAHHFAQRALESPRIHLVLTVAAAGLARLDRLEDARALVDEMNAATLDDPAGYWRAVHPYADATRREELFAALRLAGIEVWKRSATAAAKSSAPNG